MTDWSTTVMASGYDSAMRYEPSGVSAVTRYVVSGIRSSTVYTPVASVTALAKSRYPVARTVTPEMGVPSSAEVTMPVIEPDGVGAGTARAGVANWTLPATMITVRTAARRALMYERNERLVP